MSATSCRHCGAPVSQEDFEAMTSSTPGETYCSVHCKEEAVRELGTRYIQGQLRKAFDVPARSRV